ncbi:MAG: F0F1 ATP synthase subunit A [Chitinophagaceae bacterium]
MTLNSVKSILVAVLSLSMLFGFNASAQENEGHSAQANSEDHEKKKGFDANEVIFGHVKDAHAFHFLSYEGSDGTEHELAIPLPVILYSPQNGFSTFISSAFHHGEVVDGYKLVDGKVVPVDPSVKVYDVSLTRNVVQMLLALALFVWLMLNIAAKYKKGIGTNRATTGVQTAIELMVEFVVNEVAKPNLGPKYQRYLPYLLTVFFFILINNIFGLIPGSANVTGNIAFTLVLSMISFLIIIFSANKHYWSHIINPPVPTGVKPILVLVEVLSIFTKPFALMIRLFANMLAGHIIIICLVSLIFIFGSLNKGVGWAFSPISVGFSVFIYFIEILVAFIQAFIFANLSAVFIGQAIEDTHAHPAEDHQAGKYDDAVIV